MSFTDDTNAILQAQNMNVNILESAKKHKNLRRVVLTSSSCAAFYPTVNRSVPVDHGMSIATTTLLPLLLRAFSDSWNEYAVQTASQKSCPPEMLAFVVHGACKVQAEREAWKWMEQNHHPFVLNTVLPYWTVGMPPGLRVCFC